jgi:hypothetical protein
MQAVLIVKSLLQRVVGTFRGNPFYSGDLRSVGPNREIGAGFDGLPVQ